ncbi:DUF262 domain-containing protein [Chitinophaga sp. S165]|uniref:DUF262 domain-containing protein n=1 Tax=Chitinophaga sp. S165 TaxID=2135462 RepID=UPI000D715C55|nr:DUF262 domain-containing protein [Chitinophaga sp. S165]PWV51725.1 uncharacterized protein DUF262 [Chitinophaga sp. S165]
MAKDKKPVLDIQRLEKEIELQRNSLSTDRLDMSFGEIMSMYERDEIIIDPAFQRLFRWDIEQQSRFIESILLGIPIPPIFVAEDGDGRWELVDGLQRVSTVLSFFGILRTIPEKNDWILEEGDRVESMEGFSGNTLPYKFKLNIRRATCRVEIIRWNSNYDMRFELFNRLNTGGTPLTPQEIRNCIYRGISTKFNDFLKKLSIASDFVSLTALSPEQQEELYNEELVLRFLSLYKNRGKIKTSIAQHMTNFMRDALANSNFDYAGLESVFNKVVKLLKPLGKEIFRQSNGMFATALYDTIMIGVAENISKYNTESSLPLLQDKIKELRNDEVLIKFSRKGGNNKKSRILNRLKEANRIFGN